MARRRFFVDEVRRGHVQIAGSDAGHLVRVLRVEAGQRYELSDNKNVYLAQVETARKGLVSFQVIEELEKKITPIAVTLSPALFKFDHFEWMIEKATELGVATIRPFESVRTERGLGQAAVKRSSRWERIALEASQQSRRDHLPVIESTIPFAKVLQSEAKVRLLLDELPEARPILACLHRDLQADSSVELLLGPEGGWTDEEHESAISRGWQPCSVGNTILRAETAAIAAVSVVMAAASSSAEAKLSAG
ncbi:MAG: RsmE family RNA methyltransferase [Bryobacteraceae bacterium]